MDIESRRYIRTAFVVVVLLCFASEAGAQRASDPYDVAPALEVSTNKPWYRQYEPVILKIRLTNPSDEVQQYGPVGMRMGRLRIRVFNPTGDEINLHDIYLEGIITWSDTPMTLYGPGETKEMVFNLLILYPVGYPTGTYRAEISFPQAPGSENHKTASTSFEVRAPEGADPQLVATLGTAKRSIANGSDGITWDSTLTDNLNRVLGSQGALPYMKELALYLKGWRNELQISDYWPYADERADSLYSIFLDRYPNSVYAPLVEPPFDKMLYDFPEETRFILSLPAALILAVADATVSFAGNAFRISGLDHTLQGRPTGAGDAVRGIFTTTAGARQAILDALKRNQQDNVEGTGNTPAVAAGTLPFDPAVLTQHLLDEVMRTLGPSPTGSLGSTEAPVIAYAPEGTRLSGGFTGTGILIVDGALQMRGRSTWKGLVIVRPAERTPPMLSMRGNARIIGGALLYAPGGSSASIELRGDVEVLFSREVLDLLESRLSQ